MTSSLRCVLEKKPNGRELAGRILTGWQVVETINRGISYSGQKSYLASLPMLLWARILDSLRSSGDEDPLISEPVMTPIWKNTYTTSSEEYKGSTPKGLEILVISHGRGILTLPQRLERAMTNGLGLIGSRSNGFSIGLTPNEWRAILSGRLPNGMEKPLYSFNEFRSRELNLPRDYAVALSYKEALKADTSIITDLYDNPLFIARCGGCLKAKLYIDSIVSTNRYYLDNVSNLLHKYSTDTRGNPQGNLLYMLGETNYGISSRDSMFSGGLSCIAVAKADLDAFNAPK